MNHNPSAPQKFPGYILALTGPSGVGKSTISRMLTRVCSEYAENVAIITTRAPKRGDDGEYIYVAPEEFEHMKRTGAIVAATRIPSSSEDRQYGYRGKDIEVVWSKGKVPVVITEMHLLESLARYYGRRSILSFGLLPPGKSKRAKLSQLLHRLRTRGRETEAHIRDRLKNAEHDLTLFTEREDLFDHVLVNEDLSALVASLEKKVSVLLAA
jgi:guanylate kinase